MNCRIRKPAFWRDSRGSVGLIFALALGPMLMLMSVGMTYSDGLREKGRLQAVVDSAALAGAQAYASSNSASTATRAVAAYIKGASSTLHGQGFNYTATPSTLLTNGLTSSYSMKVSATDTIAGKMSSLVGSLATFNVSSSATASVGASYTATFLLNNFYSSACDGDTLYWYIVPSDQSVPSGASLIKLWSNVDISNPPAATMQLQFGQKIGFAVKNTTGQLCKYGKNDYGSTPNQDNWFYSHLVMPSKVAYPTVTQNCSLMTVLDPTAAQLPPNLAGTAGTCGATPPDYAALDCSQMLNHTVLYLWNDMGGKNDDKDYNDVDYTVSCSAASSQAGAVATLTR